MTPAIPLLFGSSATMAKVLDQCERYAAIAHPVLILGPPGTGKTQLARYIHGLSGRPGEFVGCPMPEIPSNMEHAHLAGHVRGAFTGAHADRPGLIEQAHRGTLFLDEIGVATPRVQETLLHLLDEGTVRRVGASRVIPVDVRIIAATNADLEAMRDAGTFRRDLLGRFGFLRIRLPPLKERPDEILPLMKHYLTVEAAKIGRPSPPGLSDRVWECLLAAPWADNIRELRALATYVALHVPAEGEVRLEHLPPEFLATLPDMVRVRAERTVAQRARDALEAAGGNKTKAAKLLGVSRRHFYRILGTDNSEV